MLSDLSPRQVESIRLATARLNIWHGSVRSGKTVASEIAWLRFLRNGPIGDLVMVGKTERTLMRNILNPLQSMLGRSRVRVASGRGEASILGRRVYLVGANDESSEQKIRGGTFAGAYGDELTLWPESFWQMLLSRLSVPGARLFGTTNADGPYHYLKVNVIDREDELDLSHFPFRLADNPHLDPVYVASLGREYTGLWKRRFIDGEWCLAEGVIWDAFDPDAHCFDVLPADLKFRRHLIGIDYGTSNPFVALLLGVDTQGRYWVIDEWRWDSRRKGRQLTDAQYRTGISEWIQSHGVRIERIWCDPSAASFIVECRNHGLDMIGPAHNAVDDGLRAVATAMASDRVRIARGLSVAGEIQSYVWDPKAAQRGLDEPLKQNDHGPDALRYAIASDTTRRITGLVA